MHFKNRKRKIFDNLGDYSRKKDCFWVRRMSFVCFDVSGLFISLIHIWLSSSSVALLFNNTDSWWKTSILVGPRETKGISFLQSVIYQSLTWSPVPTLPGPAPVTQLLPQSCLVRFSRTKPAHTISTFPTPGCAARAPALPDREAPSPHESFFLP